MSTVHALARMRSAAAAVALAALLTGCAAESPMGPSASPSPSPQLPVKQDALTVRVLSRASETPIVGAAVQTVEARTVTDSTGTAILTVIAGEELEVNVSAAGYESMAAAAVLGPNERWTFYLQSLE